MFWELIALISGAMNSELGVGVLQNDFNDGFP